MSELICMVYSEHGNAVDAFPYTAEELEARLKALRGSFVTIKPSPFVIPNTTSNGAA